MRVLVLLSGGIDSTVVLADAVHRYGAKDPDDKPGQMTLLGWLDEVPPRKGGEAEEQ